MKKIKLVLLLLFCTLGIYAQKTAPKQYFVLKYNEVNMDTVSKHVCNMDSVQIDYLNHFLTDTIPYYARDIALQSDIDTLKSDCLKFQGKVEAGEYNSTKLWIRILLFSLAFLLILNVLYLVLRFRGLREDIVDVVRDSSRIKEWLNNNFEKTSQPVMTKSYDYEIRNLQSENRDLKDRVSALEDALRNNNASSGMESNSYVNQQSSSRPIETQKLLYSDSIIDGMFSHVREHENDDTVFVLRLRNDTNASITLYKGAYNKVLANASYLEGCEKQILGSNSVEIAREGEAEMVSNGKWKVVIPLKVEIR